MAAAEADRQSATSLSNATPQRGTADVPPFSVAGDIRVFRHCNGLDARVRQARAPVFVQTLVAQSSVERHQARVLIRLAGSERSNTSLAMLGVTKL